MKPFICMSHLKYEDKGKNVELVTEEAWNELHNKGLTRKDGEIDCREGALFIFSSVGHLHD